MGNCSECKECKWRMLLSEAREKASRHELKGGLNLTVTHLTAEEGQVCTSLIGQVSILPWCEFPNESDTTCEDSHTSLNYRGKHLYEE